ncbi:hypothetical protein PAHAL_5G194400 [Panicum hallii]|uniref:Uncharacterized protein n=1 Tax=Panicum hallii TaxID=206008 RepID=A0A2T8IKJ1_9POAL|nr:hypothetical protein PAHAL_5G194400 [Panicum hallii]
MAMEAGVSKQCRAGNISAWRLEALGPQDYMGEAMVHGRSTSSIVRD